MFDVLGRLDIRPLGNETYPGYVNRTQGISSLPSLSFYNGVV